MGTATQAKAPLFTRSALVALIWPLFLEQTLSVTMGMVQHRGIPIVPYKIDIQPYCKNIHNMLQ